MSSDICTDKKTLSDFKIWREISLKDYLSARKKNIDKGFETLVCRLVYKPLSSILPATTHQVYF